MALGTLVRERRKERHYERISELVPNADGLVHGPTRAEIILVLLRHVAFAPFIAVLTAFAVAIVEGLTKVQVVPNNGRGWLSATGTAVFALSVLSLRRYLRPRKLLRVRARIFEPGREPYSDIFFCVLWALFVAAALVR